MSIFNRGRSHSTTATPYTASSAALASSTSSIVGRTLSSPNLLGSPSSLSPAPSTSNTNQQHAAHSFLLRKNPHVLARLYCSLADNSVHPPDYTSIAPLAPRYPIYPRPEEGKEVLPQYEPAVYREGVMCRKQELVSPYLMANQRAWQLVYVQLNNTQLNIYGLTPTTEGPSSATVTVKTKRGSVAGVPAAVAEIEAVTTAPAHPHALPGSLVCGGAFRVGKLVHSYTLQFGEVGLAVDYSKRPYVLRVRLEAEQFLLETGTPEQQIAWINGVQMGIDVALSLEERGLPKCRMIPRRRRGGSSEQQQGLRTRHQGNPFARLVSRLQNKHRRGGVGAAPAIDEATPDVSASAAVTTTAAAASEASSAGVAFARSGSGPSAHGPGSSTTGGNVSRAPVAAVDCHASDTAVSGLGPLLLRGGTHSSSHDVGALAQINEAASSATNNNRRQDRDQAEMDEQEEMEMARETEDDEGMLIYDIDDDLEEEEEDYDLSSMPSSASTTSLQEETDEDAILKWSPERPEQTHKGFLKYAHRCLIPLPASTPWVDKPVVHKGRKYIVKQDVLERVNTQRVVAY